MTDFIDNRNVEFSSSISPFMKMGISLFQEELQQTGGNNIEGLSNLYFPGGLFVTDYVKNLREEEDEEKDPSKIEVTENFDVFIDLVSNNNNNNNNSSIKSNNKSIKSNKSKTKRSSVKKLKKT